MDRNLPLLDPVGAAIATLQADLQPVSHERLEPNAVHGRILAERLLADRPSPALDVSAMDGYAIRIADANLRTLPVQTTTVAGGPPGKLEPGMAIRIFTGAALPMGADCVVKREETTEQEDSVTLNRLADTFQLGQNIRRQGENVARGECVLNEGQVLNSSAMAAVASFARSTIAVCRRVRVTILNTGDELAAPGQDVEDWQIRDSNGPVLESWLRKLGWIELLGRLQVADRLEAVQDALKLALETSDAVLLTGGVSMGDTDFVPEAIVKIGGEIRFHRLPIRPGKPILGAATNGKLILGLPGNPVSVAVTSRVFGMPLLGALAGSHVGDEKSPRIEIANPDDKMVDLTWYRLMSVHDNRVRLLPSLGSGDLVSLARSDGFVAVPPGQASKGALPVCFWE